MRLIKDERVDVRGVGFDNVTLESATSALSEHIKNGDGLAAVYTPNSEIVEMCVEDEGGELYGIINSAELIIPDGIGVIKAAKILDTPLQGKVAGVDLGANMIKFAAESGTPIYFLGGKPGVAEDAKAKLTEKYPSLIVAGVADGYFKKTGEESDLAVKKIADSGAKILYVCLGAPAQERWIYENKSALSAAGVKCAMGLGGSLDIFAGNVKRAPKIFIKLGLEWFYRLLCDPKRIGRMMALPRFYFGTKKYAKAKKKQKAK